jgi:hypothetical protein
MYLSQVVSALYMPIHVVNLLFFLNSSKTALLHVLSRVLATQLDPYMYVFHA